MFACACMRKSNRLNWLCLFIIFAHETFCFFPFAEIHKRTEESEDTTVKTKILCLTDFHLTNCILLDGTEVRAKVNSYAANALNVKYTDYYYNLYECGINEDPLEIQFHFNERVILNTKNSDVFFFSLVLVPTRNIESDAFV